MNKSLSSNRAITLIALIITIIVMLILVGVSIQVLINSDLIGIAQDAGTRTEEAYEEESNLNNVAVNGQTLDEYLSSLNPVELPWVYNTNADGEIEITGIDITELGYSTSRYAEIEVDLKTKTLTIPANIDGKDVVSAQVVGYDMLRRLGGQAWDPCYLGVEKLIIEQGIKVFTGGTNRFAAGLVDCKEFVFPTTLEELGYEACAYTALSGTVDLTHTALTTLGEDVFYDTEVKCVKLPDTVTSIDSLFGRIHATFDEYGSAGETEKSLEEIAFPNGINDALTIPDDLWGAEKVTIEGVEYTPST